MSLVFRFQIHSITKLRVIPIVLLSLLLGHAVAMTIKVIVHYEYIWKLSRHDEVQSEQ